MPLTSTEDNSPSTQTLLDDAENKLLFEFPLKENIRGFMRLEQLFRILRRCQKSDSEDCHLLAMKTLFEILDILERGDTRAELIKEQSRLLTNFKRLSENPEVDQSKLSYFVIQLEKLQRWVSNYQGKFGDRLRKDPMLDAIRHRIAIAGGSVSFDCPELHLFLAKSADKRRIQFNAWMDEIKGVPTSIDVILRISRETGLWQNEEAPMGSFFIDLGQKPLQILRVRVDRDSELFPEISAGKHRIIIHFMKFNRLYRKEPFKESIPFQLACCS